MVGNEEIRDTSNEEVQEEQGVKDWEASAKYFQSEKDKLAVENENLKKYEKIGKLIEQRPDIQSAIANTVSGNGAQAPQNNRVALNKDEFDPWEAYNDPKSKSYAFRMQEIGDVVNQQVGKQMQGVQRNTAMTQLKADLTAKGLNGDDVEDFISFAGTPANELGVDNVIKMWRAVKETPATENNPLDQVRNTQNIPQSGGVLQGERPQVKDDIDSMWDGIVKAGGRSNVLK
jgi:hypothetical protein